MRPVIDLASRVALAPGRGPTRMPRHAWLLLVGFFLVALAGCGGPKLAPVKGRVTVAGKPVRQGRIMFYPAGAPGATGAIAQDGTFSLTTLKPGDGAVIASPGRHRGHRGRAGSMRPASPRRDGDVQGASSVCWLRKVGSCEKLTRGILRLAATVKAGENTIDFDIPRNKVRASDA